MTVARPTYLPALDGLRAIAVLLVLSTHIQADELGLSGLYVKLKSIGGYIGVDVFFVLSGFLITRILLAEKTVGKPVRLFIARRMLRIFPAYYLLLGIVTVWRPGPELLPAAFYLSNYYFAFHREASLLSHTWSLAVEEHFYLVWPFLVGLLSVGRSRQVMQFIILPGALALSAILVFGNAEAAANLVYNGTQSRVFSLGTGCIVAFIERSSPAALLNRTGLALALIATGLASAFIAGKYESAPFWNLICFAAISLGMLLLGLTSATAGRVLSISLLRSIGTVSYGIYLFHVPAYHLVMGQLGWFRDHLGQNLGTTATLVSCVLLTFVFAGLSYFVVERPILALKNRF